MEEGKLPRNIEELGMELHEWLTKTFKRMNTFCDQMSGILLRLELGTESTLEKENEKGNTTTKDTPTPTKQNHTHSKNPNSPPLEIFDMELEEDYKEENWK